METEIDQTQMKNNNNNNNEKKPRILCLHGFRTSGEILKKQMGRWPEMVLGRLDLVFLDGPCPAAGQSDVQGFFDPPYYEWFQFRQGAIISAALPGMQLHGVALTKVPKIKFLIIMSGAKLGGSKLISGGRFEGSKFGLPKIAANVFSSTVKCPSLHIIGEADFLKETGIELLESFEEPVVIDHPKGHTIARLDEKGLKTMLSFIEKVKEIQLQQE
ncbi:esterase AAEL000016-like isoform X2 [Camellia sinensis]|uniref:esterase AAEL000016-like isoform X2 n=1 Tax=Camellia sinensis TaxID=4442 RepID=UPI001036DD60|nr:esterase AAEL000016-like isoform X2 [Camellia sinensis]